MNGTIAVVYHLVDLECARHAIMKGVLCCLPPGAKSIDTYPANNHEKHTDANKYQPMYVFPNWCLWRLWLLGVWPVVVRGGPIIVNHAFVSLLDVVFTLHDVVAS